MRFIFSCLFGVAALASTSAMADSVAPGDVSLEDGKISQSLTGKPGDPAVGRSVFANRKLGNCLACHQNNDLSEESFHGEVGPEMNGVADRWEEAELRAIIVNSKAIFGDQTIMPAFYNLHEGFRIADDFAGKTILSAQDVEDVLAYLKTLKEE